MTLDVQMLAYHIYTEGAFVNCINPGGCNYDTAWIWDGPMHSLNGDVYTSTPNVEQWLHYHITVDVPCGWEDLLVQVYADVDPSVNNGSTVFYACQEPASITCGSEFTATINGAPVDCNTIHHSKNDDANPKGYNCAF